MLIGVHLLIAIHIAHWWQAGTTLAPLEPSEAMQFSKAGVVNAGLIFFALTILSTLILGRWFCGWACHLVALQDLARWVLLRFRMRPKPFRSRVLATVPLVAFLYMFVAPLIYRALAGEGLAPPTVHLTTDRFWETFPSWIPALLTLLVCGFVAIYYLGAKGFCTFGCPYGAIFGVADQLALWRTRVNDDCTGSGHCTAACSSNVRVHQEVRDYGMVVDPGCMKCLDCVSVCPNDALYFGPGLPALLARRTSSETGKGGVHTRQSRRNGAALSHIVTITFLFAACALFTAFDREFTWQTSDVLVSAILTVLSFGVVLVLPGKSERIRDFSLAEECLLATFFLLAMAAFRGLYGLVGFLFALGVSVLVAHLSLKAVFLFTCSDVALGRAVLRRARRLRPAGYAYGGVMACLAAFWIHSAAVRYHDLRARALDRTIGRIEARPASASSTVAIPAEARQRLARGLHHARFVERWSLLANLPNALRLAHWSLLDGAPDEYERRLSTLAATHPDNTALCVEWASYLAATERPEQAVEAYRRHLERQPQAADAYLHLGRLLTAQRRFEQAEQILERGLANIPHAALLQYGYGVLEAERGNLHRATERFASAIDADPTLLAAHLALGGAYCALGQTEDGIAAYRAALEQDPRNAEAHLRLGLAYARSGDLSRGRRHVEASLALHPASIEAKTALSWIAAASERSKPSRALANEGQAPPVTTQPAKQP